MQATELADAVVDVHHEVARLEAHELLDGQGLLVLLVAVLEPETVVALEDLVVGVDRQFQPLIHKSFAEFRGYGLVLHLVPTVGENVVKPLELRALAGHHERGEAVLVAVLQVLREEVEILVEPGLVLLGKIDGNAVGETGASAEFDHAVGLESALKTQPRGVELTRSKGLGQAGALLIKRLRLLHLLVQLVDHTADIPRPHAAGLPEEVEEGFPRFLHKLVLHVWDDDGPVHLAHAELVGGVEFADAVHLIAEQFDAVRVIEGVAEDVDDAPSDSVFTWLVDVFDLLETVVNQELVDEILGNAVAPLDGVGVALELLSRGDLFSHRLWKADHADLATQGFQLVHHLGAHGHVGVVRTVFLVGHPGAAGVEQDLMAARPEQGLEVVHEIGRALLVLEQEQVVSALSLDRLCGQKSPGRANESPRLHLGPRRIQGIDHPTRPGIVIIEGKKVLQGHGRAKITVPTPSGSPSGCAGRPSPHERLARAHLPALGRLPRRSGLVDRQAPRMDLF